MHLSSLWILSLVLFLTDFISFSLCDWSIKDGFPPFNSSVNLPNVTMIKTTQVTTINGEKPLKLIPSLLLRPAIPFVNTTNQDSMGNGSVLWPKPLILNVADANKMTFAEFKNHTRIVTENTLFNVKDEDNWSPNEGNSNEIEPTDWNDQTSHNHTRTSEICSYNKLPNPTLTPNLHPKPRFATIQWRRVIFPNGFPETVQDYGRKNFYRSEYKPFYYRKTVKYRPKPTEPEIPTINPAMMSGGSPVLGGGSAIFEGGFAALNERPVMPVHMPYGVVYLNHHSRPPFTRVRYPSLGGKKKSYSKLSRFPNILGRLKKGKYRPKSVYPAFGFHGLGSYKPRPAVTLISGHSDPATFLNSEDQLIRPNHIGKDSSDILSQFPNPRRGSLPIITEWDEEDHDSNEMSQKF